MNLALEKYHYFGSSHSEVNIYQSTFCYRKILRW